MNAEMFKREAGNWVDAGQDGGEQVRHRTRWVLCGCVMGAVALVLAGYLLGHAPVPGLQARMDHQQIRLGALKHTLTVMRRNATRCWTYSDDIQTIQRLADSGRFSSAAALANLDLSDPARPVCPQPHTALEQLWYTASIEGLLGAAPTSPLDPSPALAWQSIERRADALGLPTSERTSPLTIFTQAYNRQEWGLARAAFLHAWGRLVGPSDLSEVEAYYSTLRNLGRALWAQASPAPRHSGLVMLSTARAISDVYSLKRGEATSDLIWLAGPHPRRWPRPDWHDPVLLAGKTRP